MRRVYQQQGVVSGVLDRVLEMAAHQAGDPRILDGMDQH